MLDDKTQLKIEHKHIYSVSDSSGTEYLFRALTLSEISIVEDFVTTGKQSTIEIEDYCLGLCLLSPKNLDTDDISPGTAKQIVDQILITSGVTDAQYIISSMNEVRQKMAGEILLDIKSYIISAMPAYTEEMLNNYSMIELLEKLVLSEKILQLQSDLAGLGTEIRLEFEQQGQPKEQKEKKPVSKEELLRRIEKSNAESASPFRAYDNPNGLDAFQGFDMELLEKLEGRPDPDDPIARKLHGG